LDSHQEAIYGPLLTVDGRMDLREGDRGWPDET
jgi:hypothetical protein